MKANRTFSVRREAFLFVSYYKAKSSIESDAQTLFWDQVFSELIREAPQIKSVKCYSAQGRRIPTGGAVSNEVYGEFLRIGDGMKLLRAEVVEFALYLYAKKHCTKKEWKFFEIEEWGFTIQV